MILFASFFSFIPATVGFARFGVTSGALSTASAVIGLSNIPLSTISHDSHKPVMVAFLVASVVLFAFPALLRWDRLRRAALMVPRAHSIQSIEPKAGIEEGRDGGQPDANVQVHS